MGRLEGKAEELAETASQVSLPVDAGLLVK
jgi:hypothetical protein